MRVVLVGSRGARRRLRDSLAGTPLDIVGEAETLEQARTSGLIAEAFLVAPEDSSPARTGRRSDDELLEPLTPREGQVLELMADGLPNKAIAARLGISDQTVKFHVASICGKLQVTNRTEAVRVALRRGLITL
jgi:two-component system, NarL family, nitrate/nitrite response regulator NarL